MITQSEMSANIEQSRLSLPDGWVTIELASVRDRNRAVDEFVNARIHYFGEELNSLKNALKFNMDMNALAGAESYSILLLTNVFMSVFVYRLPDKLPEIRRRLNEADAKYLESSWIWGPMYRAWRTDDVGLNADYWLDPNDGAGVFHARFSANRTDDVENMLGYFDHLISTLEVPSKAEEAR